jgi:RHH-type proline utilization regulon transcriptional repressor/proline dehydrogenase/delta 1-pyrroline-5-carboxylate dehydrogenase
VTDRDLEPEIQRIGREILDRMGARRAAMFDPGRWAGQVMDRAMRDEAFKIALFRFVDVLPTLRDPGDAAALFAEYVEGVSLPTVFAWGLKHLESGSVAGRLAGRALQEQVNTLASTFIAAETIERAGPSLTALWNRGYGATAALLGEAALSEPEADAYRDRYRELIAAVADASRAAGAPSASHSLAGLPAANVSIKASSLDARLDPADLDGSLARVAARLDPIVRAARDAGAHAHLDMEQYALKDLLLRLARRLFSDGDGADAHAGLVIQAYLRDAEPDLRAVLDWASRRPRPLTIRLVKGAYWDSEVITARQKGWPIPVLIDKAATDAQFERLTRLLLDHAPGIRPAIGSHNVRSLAAAIAHAEHIGLPRSAYELQFLYGMGDAIAEAVSDMGYGVRIYAPVGALIPGMAYLVRRLLENSANESFLRRRFQEREDADALLAPPVMPLVGAHGRAPLPDNDGLPHGKAFTNEPPLDFSRHDVREAIRTAIARAREALGRSYPLIIDGRRVDTGRASPSFNPAQPSEIIGHVAQAGRDQADLAVIGAAGAFAAWRRVPVEDRARVLRETAARLREARFDLTALEVLEVGKHWREADADVCEAIDFLEYYASEMLRLAPPRRLSDLPGEDNLYWYVPRGVGFVVAPWNFPVAIPAGMIAAALVAGNTVVFKPSALAPVLGARLVDAFAAAGLPPGVLQFLPGPGSEIGDHVVEHPLVDFITFTGSKEVGLRIVERAARTPAGQRHVKRVIAEMGGKNAVIVDRTADPDEAVAGVLSSAFGYQGQKCSACSRVIVEQGIADVLTTRLTRAIESLPVGSPEDPANRVGPVIDAAARDRIQAIIERGVADGLALRVASPPSLPGYYVAPALFGPVPPGHLLAQEEIFGPVLSILIARDFDHALALANDVDFALTGGVYSRSPANIRKAADAFEVGNLYINRPITGAIVGRQPFGGFRLSGVGSKAGGPDYLPQFLIPKSYSENTTRHGFAPTIPP